MSDGCQMSVGEPIAIDQRTAAKMVGLSARTLARLADRGEPIGRVRIGSRVVYLVAALRDWLESQARRGGAS